MFDLDSPIPFLPVDLPIPFRPHGASAMQKKPKPALERMADELARLTETRDNLDLRIADTKAAILSAMGELQSPHNELRGKKSLWDVRRLAVETTAWKKIAEELKAPTALLLKHTASRVQVSFRRMPLEVV